MLGEAFTPALHRVRASDWNACKAGVNARRSIYTCFTPSPSQPLVCAWTPASVARRSRCRRAARQSAADEELLHLLYIESEPATGLQARSLARLRRKQTSGRRKRQTESISPSAASSLKFGDHGRCQLEKWLRSKHDGVERGY